jgi:hypothetical protein
LAPDEVTGDLPATEDESSPNPDFSHRRKKASGPPPAVEEPLDENEPSPLKPNPFKDDVPDSSRKLGWNELRPGPQPATQASFGYAYGNPLREDALAPVSTYNVRAAFGRQSFPPPRTQPRHANPLRGGI